MSVYTSKKCKIKEVGLMVENGSNPEVLFKALTLLVNLLYIFIYAYAALP